MTGKALFYACLVITLTSESQGQTSTYPDYIEARMLMVEDSLINWGKTHEKDQQRFTIEELMEHNNVPGLSIAIINDYKIEWAKAYGLAHLKKKRPVTTNTAFRAASISKSINAMGIIKLAEDQRLDLHEDINNILTSWKFPYTRNKPTSTYQLLTHTSGIWSHWTSSYNHGSKKPSLVKMLNRKKSPKDKSKPYLYTYENPGTKFQYSNAGVSVSQQVIIDVTGMQYEDYMWQTIFDPLHTDNSFYELDKKTHEYASGYKGNGKPVSGEYRPVVEYAPAGLWTTPTDLAKFVIELQLAGAGKSEKIVSCGGAELMLTQAVTELPHSRNVNFGMGTFLSHKGQQSLLFSWWRWKWLYSNIYWKP